MSCRWTVQFGILLTFSLASALPGMALAEATCDSGGKYEAGSGSSGGGGGSGGGDGGGESDAKTGCVPAWVKDGKSSSPETGTATVGTSGDGTGDIWTQGTKPVENYGGAGSNAPNSYTSTGGGGGSGMETITGSSGAYSGSANYGGSGANSLSGYDGGYTGGSFSGGEVSVGNGGSTYSNSLYGNSGGGYNYTSGASSGFSSSYTPSFGNITNLPGGSTASSFMGGVNGANTSTLGGGSTGGSALSNYTNTTAVGSGNTTPNWGSTQGGGVSGANTSTLGSGNGGGSVFDTGTTAHNSYGSENVPSSASYDGSSHMPSNYNTGNYNQQFSGGSNASSVWSSGSGSSYSSGGSYGAGSGGYSGVSDYGYASGGSYSGAQANVMPSNFDTGAANAQVSGQTGGGSVFDTGSTPVNTYNDYNGPGSTQTTGQANVMPSNFETSAANAQVSAQTGTNSVFDTGTSGYQSYSQYQGPGTAQADVATQVASEGYNSVGVSDAAAETGLFNKQPWDPWKQLKHEFGMSAEAAESGDTKKTTQLDAIEVCDDGECAAGDKDGKENSNGDDANADAGKQSDGKEKEGAARPNATEDGVKGDTVGAAKDAEADPERATQTPEKVADPDTGGLTEKPAENAADTTAEANPGDKGTTTEGDKPGAGNEEKGAGGEKGAGEAPGTGGQADKANAGSDGSPGKTGNGGNGGTNNAQSQAGGNGNQSGSPQNGQTGNQNGQTGNQSGGQAGGQPNGQANGQVGANGQGGNGLGQTGLGNGMGSGGDGMSGMLSGLMNALKGSGSSAGNSNANSAGNGNTGNGSLTGTVAQGANVPTISSNGSGGTTYTNGSGSSNSSGPTVNGTQSNGQASVNPQSGSSNNQSAPTVVCSGGNAAACESTTGGATTSNGQTVQTKTPDNLDASKNVDSSNKTFTQRVADALNNIISTPAAAAAPKITPAGQQFLRDTMPNVLTSSQIPNAIGKQWNGDWDTKSVKQNIEELGLSKQQVDQIVTAARAAGLTKDIQAMGYGDYKTAADVAAEKKAAEAKAKAEAKAQQTVTKPEVVQQQQTAEKPAAQPDNAPAAQPDNKPAQTADKKTEAPTVKVSTVKVTGGNIAPSFSGSSGISGNTNWGNGAGSFSGANVETAAGNKDAKGQNVPPAAQLERTALSSLQGLSREQQLQLTMMNRLITVHGKSVNEAAALVGHIQWESGGFDPKATGDNGSAKGLMQWRLDRALNLLKFVGATNFNQLTPDTFLKQIDYLAKVDYPLQAKTYPELNQLKNASLVEAAKVIGQKFVRPAAANNVLGVDGGKQRLDFAQQALNTWRNFGSVVAGAGAAMLPDPANAVMGKLGVRGRALAAVQNNINAAINNVTRENAFIRGPNGELGWTATNPKTGKTDFINANLMERGVPIGMHPKMRGGGFGDHRQAAGNLGNHSHQGVDWMAPRGTPVYAQHSGTVIKVGKEGDGGGNMGNRVWIRADNGAISEVNTTGYGHMETVTVKEGQRVNIGDKIGTVGNSGARWSDTHLHIETRVGGVGRNLGTAIDPNQGLAQIYPSANSMLAQADVARTGGLANGQANTSGVKLPEGLGLYGVLNGGAVSNGIFGNVAMGQQFNGFTGGATGSVTASEFSNESIANAKGLIGNTSTEGTVGIGDGKKVATNGAFDGVKPESATNLMEANRGQTASGMGFTPTEQTAADALKDAQSFHEPSVNGENKAASEVLENNREALKSSLPPETPESADDGHGNVGGRGNANGNFKPVYAVQNPNGTVTYIDQNGRTMTVPGGTGSAMQMMPMMPSMSSGGGSSAASGGTQASTGTTGSVAQPVNVTGPAVQPVDQKLLTALAKKYPKMSGAELVDMARKIQTGQVPMPAGVAEAIKAGETADKARETSATGSLMEQSRKFMSMPVRVNSATAGQQVSGTTDVKKNRRDFYRKHRAEGPAVDKKRDGENSDSKGHFRHEKKKERPDTISDEQPRERREGRVNFNVEPAAGPASEYDRMQRYFAGQRN